MTVAVLERFTRAGIDLYLDGERVKYRAPAAVVTPALLAEMKAAKPEIISALKSRKRPTQAKLEAHPGRTRLLSELRKGVAWMDRQLDRWDAAGPEYELHPSYFAVLAEWDARDRAIRALYGFTGCVLSPDRCRPNSAVSCIGCVPDSSEKQG